jgi:hypothetical protein
MPRDGGSNCVHTDVVCVSMRVVFVYACVSEAGQRTQLCTHIRCVCVCVPVCLCVKRVCV